MDKKPRAKCAVDGGKITGPGGVDKVDLKGTAGEYMLPVKTVQAIGVPTLDALVRQTNGKEPGPKVVAGTERAATGGEIGSSLVDTVKNLFGFGAAAEAPRQASSPTAAPAAPPTPTPELLGWGAAANAGRAIQESKRRTQEAIDGYAAGGEVMTQEEQDREAILRAGASFGAGATKLGAAAADVFTLPIRGVMGAANTALRLPNAFGAGIPYIPESAFGGNSSSMTPYYDKYVRQNAPEAAPSAPSVVAAPEPAKPPTVPAVATANPPQTGGTPTQAPAPQLPPMPEAPMPVRDTFRNKAASGSLASFFGAAMNEKKLAQEEQFAREKAAREANREAEAQLQQQSQAAAAAQRAPEAAQRAVETDILKRRIALAEQVKDPATKAAILAGHATTADKVTYPEALQPLPSAEGTQYGVAATSRGLVRVPIRTQADLRQGSDGKTYVMGANGAPLREATQSEIAAASGK